MRTGFLGGRQSRVVLTPEHVPLRLTPAGAGSRALALLLDFMLVVSATQAAALLFNLVLPAGVATAARLTLLFALTFGYHVYFELRRNGRTLGKRALGLRVVDGRGLPITLEQSFLRNIVRVFDFTPVFYGLGGAVSLLDRDGRRLGDFLADTLVVHERTPLRPEGSLGGARRHGDLAEAGTLRRIRNRVSLEEREFLLAVALRADRLEESARYDLMQEIADHYRKKLEIDAPNLSGESLVRDLIAVLWGSAENTARTSSPRSQSLSS